MPLIVSAPIAVMLLFADRAMAAQERTRFSAASLSGISPTISFTTASPATTRRAAC